MKKIIIVANWKMNPDTLKGAKLLFNSVKKGIRNVKKTCPEISRRIEVVICPPFIYLSHLLNPKTYTLNPKFASERSKRSDAGENKVFPELGAQDCFWENPPAGRGAFTGEISPKMLKDLGIKYVIIGHSERRKYFKETNEMISKKIKAVLEVGLKPILCINKFSQAKGSPTPLIDSNVILAYEPLFAIGTGKPCSIKKARKMNLAIKAKIEKKALVLYGGSVNSQNAKDYIEKAGFQGLLIGKASLNPKEFTKIVRNIALISKNC